MLGDALVDLAVETGQLTMDDIDALLRELSRSNHRDRTWYQLLDALLDSRRALKLIARSPAEMAWA